MTQHDLVLNYLKEHIILTPMKAFEELGITKLATRISELKRMGYNFKDSWCEGYNRFGERVRYKSYMLDRSNDWSEEDLLSMSKQRFTCLFAVTDEEYEMLHKRFQEM